MARKDNVGAKVATGHRSETKKKLRQVALIAIYSTLLAVLVWGIWSLFAPVPVMTEIVWDKGAVWRLPFSVSRWWDVLFAPIWVLFISSLYLFVKPYILAKYPSVSDDDLVAGLALGLVFGLSLSLSLGLVAGLGAGLGASLVFALVAGLVAGLVFALVTGLGAGLGAGLVSGMGAGMVFGLSVDLGAGLGFGLGAGLVFALVAVLGFGLGFSLGAGLGAGLVWLGKKAYQSVLWFIALNKKTFRA